MITFEWNLQGITPTEIDLTDILQFAGSAGFNSPIPVSGYNESMHVKTAGGSNKSSGNTPKNNKFISQTGGAGGDSQVSVNGGATVNLDTLTNSDASLNINVSDSGAFAIEDAIFYAYDGTTPTDPPDNIDLRVAEITDANFTQAEGSAAALVLSDQSSNANHDYYLPISASPLAVGTQSMTLRFEGVAL